MFNYDLMNNKIINKFLNVLYKDFSPSIKEDFKWLKKSIIEDLEYLTKEKKQSKKNDKFKK